MQKVIFKTVDNLSTLEEKNEWNRARELLYDLWQAQKYDVGINFRLISECWIVLSDHGCTIELDDETYELFLRTLNTATTFWINNYDCIEIYSSMLGEMITLFPEFFYNDENDDINYPIWNGIGNNLITTSYEKYSNNEIVCMIYFGSFGVNSKFHQKYEEMRELVASHINDYFTYDTEIERYFIEVWTKKLK